MKQSVIKSISYLIILFVFFNSCKKSNDCPVINNPPDIDDQEFAITENSPMNSIVGTVIAADVDLDDILKFSILSGDINGAFIIDPLNGIIRVNDSTQIDYELNTKFELVVEVLDNKGFNSLAKITIRIIDIDESPILKHFVLNLQPDSINGKDALIFSEIPEQTGGRKQSFEALAWTWYAKNLDDGIMRSLLEFNVSEIPTDAIIDSAFLSLYNNPNSSEVNGEHSSRSGSNVAVLQRITEEWDEDTVTWNNQPLTTVQNEIILEESKDVHQDYLGINITQHIQEMVQNPSSNHGFMLKLVTEQYYRSMIFASSDHHNDSIRPKLVVYYTILEPIN